MGRALDYSLMRPTSSWPRSASVAAILIGLCTAIHCAQPAAKTASATTSPKAEQSLDDQLFAATPRGDLPAIKRLVAAGANIRAIRAKDATLLDAASYSDNLEVVKYYVERGLGTPLNESNALRNCPLAKVPPCVRPRREPHAG